MGQTSHRSIVGTSDVCSGFYTPVHHHSQCNPPNYMRRGHMPAHVTGPLRLSIHTVCQIRAVPLNPFPAGLSRSTSASGPPHGLWPSPEYYFIQPKMCLLTLSCWCLLAAGVACFLGNTQPLVPVKRSHTILPGEKDHLGNGKGNLSLPKIRKNCIWHMGACPCCFFKECCPSEYVSLIVFSLSEKWNPMQWYITDTKNTWSLQQNWCPPSLEQISPGPAEWLLHSWGKAWAWQMCLNSLSTSGHCLISM